jgi:hypothetical protein
LVIPSSWSTLLAETIGQLVKKTSFQFKGTVADTFSAVAVDIVGDSFRAHAPRLSAAAGRAFTRA